jgi:hypothetical protein
MSRSRKKPIAKDRPRNYKKSTIYWRRVRRTISSVVNSMKKYVNPDDVLIPDEKTIMNDYDYSDYCFWFEKHWKGYEKSKRK